MTDEVTEQLPLDKLTRIYIKMRAKLQDIEKEYDTKIEELKTQQQEVKNAMKDMMLAAGIKSSRTDYGTISLVQKTRYYTQDWDSFKKFVVEHDVVDLLEKRIAQTNMSKFLEENPTLVPPGLNSNTEFDISVRKPAAK
jgi:predicted Zn-dependent peptidase